MNFIKSYLLLVFIFIIYVEYSVKNILFRPNETGLLVINMNSLIHYLIHPLYNRFLWNVQLLDVNFIFIAAISPVINMIELIPISFSGIGTRDVAMIFFMGLLSISNEAAVAYSLMILIVIYIEAIPGLIYWIKHPTELA